VKVSTLLSGGKDSIYATYICQQYGWECISAVSIIPEKNSWMFHEVNSHIIPLISKKMGLPLFKKRTAGEKEKELKDLEIILSHRDIEGVISGAVASEYQRTRIEEICHRLSIKSFTPLWHKNQEKLLGDMIHTGFKIMIVSVAAEGLGEHWLGRMIDKDCMKELLEISSKYGVNILGEGGEFETLVIDCPLYKKPVIIEEAEKIWKRDNGMFIIKKCR
jgi:ABC transporter with metal-binding/Fe-S-binding domain ATP-binding protein